MLYDQPVVVRPADGVRSGPGVAFLGFFVGHGVVLGGFLLYFGRKHWKAKVFPQLQPSGGVGGLKDGDSDDETVAELIVLHVGGLDVGVVFVASVQFAGDVSVPVAHGTGHPHRRHNEQQRRNRP